MKSWAQRSFVDNQRQCNRVSKIRILKSKEATEVNQAIINAFQDWKPFLKTITS